MLRILGMSHAISVLTALDAGKGVSHANWNIDLPEPAWELREMPSALALTPYESLGYFLIRPAMNWQATISKNETGNVISAHPNYWTLLNFSNESPKSECLISFIGGNDHSVISLVEAPDPYDFVLNGSHFPLIRGRQPVDVKYVAAALEARMGQTIAMLMGLRIKQPQLRIFHVLPPPPIASERQIYSEPEIFREVLQTYGITPISVRMKVYMVYCQLLTSLLEQLSIGVISPPMEALDSIGALREEFAQGCTHGNKSYGELVAGQISEAVR